MKITETLLHKYWKGECTAEEKSAVETWLSSVEEETTELDLFTINRARHFGWQQLKAGTTAVQAAEKTIPPCKRTFRYVAACAVLVLGLVVSLASNSHLSGVQLAYNNTSTIDIKQINAPDFYIKLLPVSKVEITTGLFNKKGNMKFCGGMTLENTMQNDVTLTIASSCNDKNQISKSRKLKSGRRYIVFEHKLMQENQTFIIDEKRLNSIDLPPAVQSMALKIRRI